MRRKGRDERELVAAMVLCLSIRGMGIEDLARRVSTAVSETR